MTDSAAVLPNASDPVSRKRRRLGTLAIVLVAMAMAAVVQNVGWAQSSNYALIRALGNGTAQIDAYSWEGKDSSYYNGHFYSVKAPGMAFLALPMYKALEAVGAEGFARSWVNGAHDAHAFRMYRKFVPSGAYRNDPVLAHEIRTRIENYTPIVWMLGLLCAVIPALILMLLVRAMADWLAPGFGVLAAVITGAGTLILPFSTLLFSHVLSAAMALGVFAILWRERHGQIERLPLLALAGLLAGLAVTTEYPLALVGIVLGFYAITRGGWSDRTALVRRGLVYSAGAIAGVIPLLAYNLWAFGSVTHFSYANAISVQGMSGHDQLGLNDGGFFGITTPTLGNAFDLLFTAKGLFIMSPVLLLAFVGVWLMRRDGRRAEAYVIAGIFAAYLVYNAGYWLPFGGGTPGPRFLIPVLPFLGVALGPALKRFTATGLALAVPSILTMAAATITLPMIGNGDVGIWWRLIEMGNFEQTVAAPLGANNTWGGILPFIIPGLLGLALAVAVSTPLKIARDALIAAGAVLAWMIAALIVPHRPVSPLDRPEHVFTPMIYWCAGIAFALVFAGVLVERVVPPLLRRRRRALGEPASAAA